MTTPFIIRLTVLEWELILPLTKLDILWSRLTDSSFENLHSSCTRYRWRTWILTPASNVDNVSNSFVAKCHFEFCKSLCLSCYLLLSIVRYSHFQTTGGQLSTKFHLSLHYLGEQKFVERVQVNLSRGLPGPYIVKPLIMDN